MKLHHSFGMNPRAVRMFCIEKNIDVDLVPVDLLGGENRQPTYLKKNPTGQTPVLELDDGSFLGESIAICQYLEAKNPSNPLFGTSDIEKARTTQWLRRVEFNICMPAVHAFYYKEGLGLFESRVHCIPEAAEGLKTKTQKAIDWLEEQLGDNDYIGGDRFSVADIWLYTYVDQLKDAGQPIDPKNARFNAWFNRIASRTSADASLWPEQPMGMRG